MPNYPRGARLQGNTQVDLNRLQELANRESVARAFDYFTNVPARMGWGTPSLAEGVSYELERLSFAYWTLITLYENHWITAKIVDTPARDMVKAWPKLTSEIEPKDLMRIDKKLRTTQTRDKIREAIQWGNLFGGAGALIVIDGDEDHLDEPVDIESVELGAYKGLLPFDRWTGIYPEGEICTDIDRPVDFNRPEYYRVNVAQGGKSFDVHCSRVLRFCGPEMPTPEREAHSWWGISEVVRAYEEIRKRDNMSWNILSLTFRAQVLGMKYPRLEQMLSGIGVGQQGAQAWQSRVSEINRLLSNQSMIALPADGEIQAVNYTFTGLSDCYQQFQLDISGATGIPVTRLFGRTITGLGQSNDADERIYEERIASDQDAKMRAQLEKLYPVICASELGEVPDDLDLTFPSVRVLDEKEKSDLAKTGVDTVTVAFQNGVISKRIYAKELKQLSDLTGVFTNVTDEFIATLPDTVEEEGEMGDLFGEEEGEPNLSPSASPQKVLREQGREKKDADNEEDIEPLEEIDDHEDNARLRKMARAADAAQDEGTSEGAVKAWKNRERAKAEPESAERIGKTGHLEEYASREQWPEHIKALKIPPAWKDVRVSPDASSDLLAVGKDSKGRPQYVYSHKFRDSQAAMKFERVASLANDMAMIDKQLSEMRNSDDERTRDHADCMTLIRSMGIRPGSESDTKAKVKAYGASTLEGHHVWQMGNATRLRFVGKKGVTISLPVEDAGLASMLRKRRAGSGDKGKLFPTVSDSSLLDFSYNDLDHGGYKTKDFRTHLATEMAQGLVEKMKAPKSEKEYKKSVREVAKQVAEKLGNTPAVCLQAYIAPQIFSAWRESYAAP